MLFNILKERNLILSTLYLSENQIDNEFMKQLGEYVEDNKHLEELVLSQTKITDKEIETLFEYLIGNMKLNNLRLTLNKGITDESALLLIDLAKKTYISKVDIWQTSISDTKSAEIFQSYLLPLKKREIPIKSKAKSAAKILISTAN